MDNAYQKMLELYESFSGQQKKVADYIVNNMEDVIYFPIAQFRQAIGVSQATIVRFAQNLGYQGFNEFRNSLIEHYRDSVSPENRLKRSIEAINNGESVYSKITENEILYLQKSIYSLDEAVFCNAVDTIAASRTLYIFAIGANEHLGRYLQFKLRRLKVSCRLIASSGREMLEELLKIGKEDSAIVYNFSKPSVDFNRVMELLSDKKVSSILITDIMSPPVIRLASIVLYAERGPKGTFQSPIVPMAITNALFLRIAEKLEDKALEAMGELGELRNKYYYTDKFSR